MSTGETWNSFKTNTFQLLIKNEFKLLEKDWGTYILESDMG